MHAAKNPISTAIKESLIEKLGAAYHVRQLLHMSPLATEVLLHSDDRGEFRARIYHVKEKDFGSFREAWTSHKQLLVDTRSNRLKPTWELEQLGGAIALTGQPVKGIQLSSYCQHVGAMAPTFATRLILKIIDLYKVLYEDGGHHLNLSLENVYLDKDSTIHFTNFGLWNFEVEIADLWGVKELLDPTFSSPEHLSGKTLTVSSEIYQLGVLYYKLLTGEMPFHGEYEEVREDHLSKTPPNPQQSQSGISIGHARILARALAKKPNERFWTLADFQKTLSLLLPQEERHSYADSEPESLSAEDTAHYQEQLNQARAQFQEGRFDDALHTVGAVLMVASGFQPAIQLAEDIRRKKNEEPIKKLWEDARYVLDMGEPDGALDPLHRILDLDPHHQATLTLQSQLFDVLESQAPNLGRQIPVQLFMEQAGVAKTLEDYSLAGALWYMVLLTPSPTDSSFFELMQMQKKVARKELETLDALSNSGGKPASKIPAQNTGASNFRDEELEELFAPISPEAEEAMIEAPDEDDALFDGLESALDESQVDLNTSFLDDSLEDPTGSPTGNTEPLPEQEMPAPTMAMPTLFQPEESPPTVPPAPQPPPVAPAASHPTPKPPPVQPQMPAQPIPQAEKSPAPAPIPEPQSVTKPTPPKKKLPLVPIIGGVAALLAIVIVVVVLQSMNKAKAHKQAAADAYAAADKLEESGDWTAALAAWKKATSDFPELGDIAERTKTLEYKIKERQADIERYLETARDFINDGVFYGNGTENAVAYLRQILALDPDQLDAKDLFQDIADIEMGKARELFAQEKVTEAREVYTQLLEANSDFADPVFEEEMDTWIDQKVIGPQLAKVETAIKRKRWDEALSLSDTLRETMRRPEMLDTLWDQAYAEVETKLADAEAKGNKAQMLRHIDLMARIKPDDLSLANQRNLLNREINQAKISNLEASLTKSLKAKSYTKAGRTANELARLDSENGLAKSALDEIRNFYLRRVRDAKNGNPRAAVTAYQSLLKVFNWKSYRNEMKTIQSRISKFDGQLKSLGSSTTQNYDEQIANAVRMTEQYNDFSQDPSFSKINQAKDRLIAEKSKLSVLTDWEKNASGNASKTYSDILQYIQKAGPFSIAYGKKQKDALLSKYRKLIENYQGAVTIVIRSGKKLPKERSGLNKAPEAFCELTTGGQTFTTGVVNNAYNPTWDFSCNFNAQPGQGLTFSVYDSDRGGKRDLLGTINLPKLPKSTKGLTLSHKDGWSITIDVRRER